MKKEYRALSSSVNDVSKQSTGVMAITFLLMESGVDKCM